MCLNSVSLRLLSSVCAPDVNIGTVQHHELETAILSRTLPLRTSGKVIFSQRSVSDCQMQASAGSDANHDLAAGVEQPDRVSVICFALQGVVFNFSPLESPQTRGS